MNYTKAELVDALVAEWEYLCHDDYDPEDPTPEEYRKKYELTVEQLIEETSTDEHFTRRIYGALWLRNPHYTWSD